MMMMIIYNSEWRCFVFQIKGTNVYMILLYNTTYRYLI